MSNDEKVTRFVQWARCSVKCATDYLQLHNWDYKAATDDYWRTNIAIY